MNTVLRDNREQASPGPDAPAGHEPVSFADLVHLHHVWRRDVGSSAESEDARRRRATYCAALGTFEREHGPIVNAYWCSEVESAVALTDPARRPDGKRHRRSREVMQFHRVSDWATKSEPEIARALHDCDELAIRACEVLRGRSQRICLQLVMASAGHLLSLVDAPAAPDRDNDLQVALAEERKELANAFRYYGQAANGEAQQVYFGGTALGMVVLLVLVPVVGIGLNIAGVDAPGSLVGFLAAGALGALVSVISRINAGSFALDFDVDRDYTLFLGALRPFLGAVFGLLTYFAVTSDFLQVFAVPGSGADRFYFLCVVSFLAGFSERWAQDTLTGGLGKGGPKGQAAAAARPRSERHQDT
ncbi:MAG: hypothetical protein M3296_03035 [Actinomycetota bacterium]|nr:hypothetical protein [Actinomycetota bacterium]